MIKLFAAAAFIALLSACSSMMGGSMADSSGMSRTNTMGGSGSMGSGGPSGASGGGP